MIEIIQPKLAKLNPDEIHVFEFVPSSPQLISDRIEGSKESGINLNELHNSICSLPDKLQLRWQIDRTGQQTFGGEICIKNPIDAYLFGHEFNSEELKQWPEISFVPDDLKKMVFDDHPLSGDSCLNLISLNEAQTDFKLYYLLRSKIIPLQLTIMQYMLLLPISMGYNHWQLFFCKPEFKAICQTDISDYKKMLSHLNSVFAQEDYSTFNPKW